MKLLVFALVLANALFYAFAKGYLGGNDNPDGARVWQQVAPDRLRIVGRGEAPKETAPPEPPAPAASEPPPAKAEPETVSEAPPAAPARVCLSWRPLSPAEADRLTSLIGQRFAEFAVSRKTQAGESNGWWVSIPPLAGKPEADKKAAELRELGVRDFFIVQEGPNRNAISLGVFSSEKGARDRLTELKSNGVRSAIVAPRPAKDETVTLQARGPQTAQADLTKASAKLLGNIEPKACK